MPGNAQPICGEPMSIEILTGVPGAGKTYFAVSRIQKLLTRETRFLILHNIEGLYPSDNRCISKDCAHSGETEH